MSTPQATFSPITLNHWSPWARTLSLRPNPFDPWWLTLQNELPWTELWSLDWPKTIWSYLQVIFGHVHRVQEGYSLEASESQQNLRIIKLLKHTTSDLPCSAIDPCKWPWRISSRNFHFNSRPWPWTALTLGDLDLGRPWPWWPWPLNERISSLVPENVRSKVGPRPTGKKWEQARHLEPSGRSILVARFNLTKYIASFDYLSYCRGSRPFSILNWLTISRRLPEL